MLFDVFFNTFPGGFKPRPVPAAPMRYGIFLQKYKLVRSLKEVKMSWLSKSD
ncbi:hypothetical protein DCCM_0177 [Desulfocucumis palustris]|uniref:Uncharacterized protein n=1 Tax=Desulfocucumis palustris TaxID=1898651 RepID=A0A2L2XCP0_9FIRM|nr:hypothetical protein DCCM_0177 [Desulfocucumis palustris]